MLRTLLYVLCRLTKEIKEMSLKHIEIPDEAVKKFEEMRVQYENLMIRRSSTEEQVSHKRVFDFVSVVISKKS